MHLTATQVAEKLGLSANTVRTMCADGRLPGINTGMKTKKRWMVDDKALREWRSTQSNGHAKVNNTTLSVPAAREEEWISLQEAAKRAGLSASAVGLRAKQGQIPSKKEGRRLFVLASKLAPKSSGYPLPSPQDVGRRVFPLDVSRLTDLAGPGKIATKLDEILSEIAHMKGQINELLKAWS